MSRPTIRVELNPKTILIAIADDRKNLCKIFAATTGRCLWAADRHEPGLFQLGPRSMLRPLEQLGHRAMPRAMHLALIAREQVGGGAPKFRKLGNVRRDPARLVARSLRRPK